MTGRGRAAVVIMLATLAVVLATIVGCARAGADGATVSTSVPARLFGEGELLEDESPYTGAHGGALVNYGDGVACYADHTATDGRGWFYVMSCEGDR